MNIERQQVKVLVTGKGGQLASELQQSKPDNIVLSCLDSSELDITDFEKVSAVIEHFHPSVVINAAAYTAVDKAEVEAQLAFNVNATGTKNLAFACQKINAGLIHISTDFVFDGESNKPYLPSDKTNPLSIYGKSKLEGENQVLDLMPNKAVIVRTAWVYSVFGQNFVKTMLRLMQERESLGVVFDQVGTPTSAKGLAQMLWGVIDNHFTLISAPPIKSTIVHWTDAGVTSWYDFAVVIHQLGMEFGLLNKNIHIKPINARDYPTPASRPRYSVLDKTAAEMLSGIEASHWQAKLRQMLKTLVNH